MQSGKEPTVQIQILVSHAVHGEMLLHMAAASSAVDLADPFSFFAYVSADQPGAFVEFRTSVDIRGGTAPVVVRAWEDDPDWGA